MAIIDLLGEITDGGAYAERPPRTVPVMLFGFSCRCLDSPTLIRVTLAIGRPRDLEAIGELQAILEEKE